MQAERRAEHAEARLQSEARLQADGGAPTLPIELVPLELKVTGVDGAAGLSKQQHVRVLLPEALQPAYGSTLSIVTGESTTAAELKGTVASVLGVSAGSVELSSGGRQLEASDSSPLGSSSVLVKEGVSAVVVGVGAAAVPSAAVVSVSLPPTLQRTHGSSLKLAASANTSV